MLAYETQNISNFLKEVMEKKFGTEQIHNHMANTRDTLCYATNENQDATYGLIKIKETWQLLLEDTTAQTLLTW